MEDGKAGAPAIYKNKNTPANGSYFFWLLGAIAGGGILGALLYVFGRSSTLEGGIIYGFMLSLAWILGSNTRGKQNYKRLNILIIAVFAAEQVYLFKTGEWWIGPEPKGRPMDLGESVVTILIVYLMIFILGACSHGAAFLWNKILGKKWDWVV